MCKTKVWVNIDRAAALSRGINGTASQLEIELDVDVNMMSSDDRSELSERFCYADRYCPSLADGAPYLRERRPTGDLSNNPLTVIEPSQDGVIAAFAASRQRIADEAQAKIDRINRDQEAGLANLNGEPESRMIRMYVQLLPDGSFHVDSYDYQRVCLGRETVEYERQYIYTTYGDDATKAACVERNKRLEADSDARKVQVVERAKERLLAEQIQPRLDWVATYGSRDLQRMVAEQLTWLPVYDDERAAWQSGIDSGRLLAERPGWVVVDPSTIEPPKRPRARAWSILDAARYIDPTAKLGMINGKYIAFAEFNGLTIIWPAD